jgi:hypothetical protein
MRLDRLPYQLRLLVMTYLPFACDRRWGTPTIALPAAWAPFAQVSRPYPGTVCLLRPLRVGGCVSQR